MLLAFALLAGCQGPGVTSDSREAGSGPVFIPLGMDPDRLVASPDGRLLLAWGQESHSLSVLDVSARKEALRIPLPVRTLDTEGKPTAGYVSRIAVDDGAAIAWAATTEGQLFRIDLATGELRTVLDDRSYAFSDVVVDGERKRVLLGTESGEVLAFDGSRTNRILRTSEEWPIGRMKRLGTTLHVLTNGETGFGPSDHDTSQLLSVDLAQDRVIAAADSQRRDVRETVLEGGIAEDLAPLAGGRILVADGRRDRILQFAQGWVPEITRETRDFTPSCIEADGNRVLLAYFGTPWHPVYEYGIVDGSPTLFPTGQYEFPDETVLDVALLRGGWFAIALKGRGGVLLVHRSTARPFGGFPVH